MQAAFPDSEDLVKIVSNNGSNTLIQSLFKTVDGTTESYLDKLKAAFVDKEDLVSILSKIGVNKLIQKICSKTLAPPKLNIYILRERFGSEFSKQFTGTSTAISKHLGI